MGPPAMSGFVVDGDVTDVGMAVFGLRKQVSDKDEAFIKIIGLCEKAEKKYFALGTVGILSIINDIERIAGQQCLQH